MQRDKFINRSLIILRETIYIYTYDIDYKMYCYSFIYYQIIISIGRDMHFMLISTTLYVLYISLKI